MESSFEIISKKVRLETRGSGYYLLLEFKKKLAIF